MLLKTHSPTGKSLNPASAITGKPWQASADQNLPSLALHVVSAKHPDLGWWGSRTFSRKHHTGLMPSSLSVSTLQCNARKINNSNKPQQLWNHHRRRRWHYPEQFPLIEPSRAISTASSPWAHLQVFSYNLSFRPSSPRSQIGALNKSAVGGNNWNDGAPIQLGMAPGTAGFTHCPSMMENLRSLHSFPKDVHVRAFLWKDALFQPE